MGPPEDAHAIERDLRDIFGSRLESLVAYGSDGPDTHTLAIVDRLTAADLAACAARAASWRERRLATPLLLASHEFEDSLDAFPLEFGAIVASHTVVAGRNPFEGVAVDPADLRRACEVQARSHLLHLREGYVEAGGDRQRLAALVVQSAAPFAALLRSLERLDPHRGAWQEGAAADVVRLAGVREIGGLEAERIFPAYLDAVERIVAHVNGWQRR
jgi:hypothetical protein